MAIKSIREKKHRLSSAMYTGKVQISYTLCVCNKDSIFTDPSIVKEFTEILRACLLKHDCLNWVYIFMPDHVHLLLEGKNEQSKLWKAIILFKQRTGFWFVKHLENIRWQKDYFDHILRKDEDLRKHIAYVLNNPVRKGLASNWRSYPFKGSLDFDLEEIIL